MRVSGRITSLLATAGLWKSWQRSEGRSLTAGGRIKGGWRSAGAEDEVADAWVEQRSQDEELGSLEPGENSPRD